MTEPSTKTGVCTGCDTSFEGARRAECCEPCRINHKRVIQRERMRTWRAAQPKVTSIEVMCRDCGTSFPHPTGGGKTGGRVTKSLCPPCIVNARRRNTNRHKAKRRAEAKAASPARTCVDCPADISTLYAKILRCEPCRREKARAYQATLRQQRGSKAKSFSCVMCSGAIDRKGDSGRPLYCAPCGLVAKRESALRSEAKRTAARGSEKATHCHYCRKKLERPQQRTSHPARCFSCKRQRQYAYMRDRTTARRPASVDCRGCGKNVPQKRKGLLQYRCGDCLIIHKREMWVQQALTHRNLRRARKRSAPVEKFSAAEIFERDGWRCGLCQRKIRKVLKHPHPLSASLDHIIPFSRGGSHTRANVQAAHLRCNLRKKNNAANEQLLLFG